MFGPQSSFTTNVFTDGSVDINNSKYAKIGGCGIFFPDDPNAEADKSITVTEKPTNNRCELMAIKLAISEWLENSYFQKYKELVIHTDSMYCIDVFTNWSHSWASNNWCKKDGKEIKNKNLIEEIYNMVYGNQFKKSIKFQHVRAHQKKPSMDSPLFFEWFGNNTADKLAKHALIKSKITE